MIEVIGLNKSYSKKIVVNNYNKKFLDGYMYIFIGENGAGKSTILRSLVDGKFPDSGEVKIDGRINTEFKSKYDIFYIEANKNYFSYFTASQYLKFVMKIYDNDFGIESENKKGIIDYLNLQDFMYKKMDELSSGTRQKFYIVAALLSGVKNLILDEPFSYLDTNTIDKVIGLFEEHIRKKKLIIFSTNRLDALPSYCSEIIRIGNSKFNECKQLR